ncbi:hypothetical protein SD71_05335 [Cohnella kolymensis]|uniref:O-antigen ligase-related domain-containing protein n=1 Tax=Cohnella kolymensis TaxID=1590652 RepID=A0ABR5A7F5_9BACL|nr:O-antigen ligase family protein [Cohnella kolymensis]KIL36832.1 hypothetical protein SD71_05335 [Cohnella kolymensis]
MSWLRKDLPAMLGFVGAASVLGWSAYRSGMFFDTDFYRLEIVLFISFCVWWAVRLLRERRMDVPLWSLLPLCMALLYAIHLAAEPLSVKGSTDSALRWTAYACCSVLCSALWHNKDRRKWGWAAIQASGLLLLAGGWAGWFGWLSFPDIVLRFNDAELSATGARLAGFMQYPNAYGAVLAAFLLMQLQTWGRGSGSARFVAAFSIVPFGAALLLTESRGAILALLLGIALSCLLLDRQARPRLLVSAGVASVLSAVTAKQAWSYLLEHQVGAVWSAAACCLAAAGLLILLDRNWRYEWFGRRSWVRRIVPWLAAAIGALIAGWLVFGAAGERVAANYGTVASRRLFYADAWEMFKDSPWLGWGGETWRMLFGLYQRQPYVGNEVHSGYVEILLDTGLAGLALLLFMLVVFIVKMWRYDRTAIAPASVLLVHAAVDFDWSYAYVWLLLIAWVMLHVPPAVHGGHRAPARTAAPAGRAALSALLLGSAAVGLWAAWRGDAAASARSAAGAAAAPAARAAQLRAALDANPAWARIRLELAPMLPARERASMLEAGLRYEPLAPPLWFELGMAYAELGDVAQARSGLREGLRLERFNRDNQTAAIASMARFAESRQSAGDEPRAREAAEAAVSFFRQYRALDLEVTAMDRPANGKSFALTTSAKFNAAKCLLILARTDEAHVLLLEVIAEDEGQWKEEAQKLLDTGSSN